MKIKFDPKNDSWLRSQSKSQGAYPEEDSSIIKIKLDEVNQILFIPAKTSSVVHRVAARWCTLVSGNR